MAEPTITPAFVRALLFPAPENAELRLRGLTELVILLMQEVEALRSLHSAYAASDEEKQRYSWAYTAAAVLAHSSAGPSTGTEKLMSVWLEKGKERREEVFLRRLGCSEQFIKKVLHEIDSAGQLS